MVTDNAPWSVRLAQWILSLHEAEIPVFGICYGHQLLARAAGGRIGYHPYGKEIGTVSVRLLPGCADDPVLQALPEAFLAHATHSQTVPALPAGATRLAANAHEPHHAFRLGECSWGVQFHPEYSVDIMRAYIEE
jgi:GMP synthase (glutamine-hydrolysing)